MGGFFRNIVLVSGVLMLTLAGNSAFGAPSSAGPNILYVLCDDLGYGDVHCLNPDRGKIATPNMDRLGLQGIIFTDAHGGSSVCTPTRYGILTGRYCWRTRLQSSVLMGDSPPLIAPDRMTVGSLLKRHGYTTACIGKWHLGMQFAKKPLPSRFLTARRTMASTISSASALPWTCRRSCSSRTIALPRCPR